MLAIPAPAAKPSETPDCTVLALTGLSPAVLSETLYVMTVQGFDGKKWWPSRIVVVTTTEGRRHIEQPEADGDFYCHALQEVLTDMSTQYSAELGGRTFPMIEVIVPTLGQAPNELIDDVDTPEKLNAMADCLGKEFRALNTPIKGETQQRPPVHLSVAGGRNGMGFVASQVIGLFGRDEDVASQILVSPDRVTQAQPRFYFVDKAVQRYLVPTTGGVINRQDIQLQLISLPRLLTKTLLDTDEQRLIFESKRSLSAIIAGVNERFVAHPMVIDTKALTIRVGSQTLVPPSKYRKATGSSIPAVTNRWSGLFASSASPPVEKTAELEIGVNEVSWQIWAFLYWVATTEKLVWSVRPIDLPRNNNDDKKACTSWEMEKALQARRLTRWPQVDGGDSVDRMSEFPQIRKAENSGGFAGFEFSKLVVQMGQTKDQVDEKLLDSAIRWSNPLMRHFFKIDRRSHPPVNHADKSGYDDSFKAVANWRLANISAVTVDGREIDHAATVYVDSR